MTRKKTALALALGSLAAGAVGGLARAAPPAASSSAPKAAPPGSSAAPSASAAASGSAAPAPSATAVPAPKERVYSSCVERIPEGSTRPTVDDTFPAKALSGHAIPLTVVVKHGAGENVLAHGYSSFGGGTEGDALRKAGFVFPVADGGAGPVLATSKPPGTTTLTVHVVALPRTIDAVELELPPIPVAVARASGEVMTVCTRPHAITILDPTAGVEDPRAKPNPPGRRQLEPFTLLIAALTALASALVTTLVAWLAGKVLRKIPRRAPAPPPPIPPWITAEAALREIATAELVAAGKLAEHVDRTSDVVRRYLGERFGFEGLEATSREIRRAIARVTPAVPVIGEIDKLLDESDLVKFARVPPAAEACEELLSLAFTIVRRTIPPDAVELPRKAGRALA